MRAAGTNVCRERKGHPTNDFITKKWFTVRIQPFNFTQWPQKHFSGRHHKLCRYLQKWWENTKEQQKLVDHSTIFSFFCHGGSQYNWINIREKWTSVWGCNAKLPLNAVQLTVSILYSKTKNMYIILWIIQKQHINLCTAPWTLLMEVQRSVCNAWSDY